MVVLPENRFTDPKSSGFVNRKEALAFLGRYGFLFALLLPAIFLFITNETFRNPLNLSNVLAQSSMVGVAAVGMTVVMILGGFDLSIGAIAALSGLVAVLVFGEGQPMFMALGIVACIGTGCFIGAINGTLVSRVGINPLIVTLAMASLVRGIVLISSEGTIHRAQGDAIEITAIALGRWHNFPIAGFFFIGAILLGWVILRFAKIGRWVYAIGGNEQAATLSGVPVSRVVIACYALMGGLAGLAGLLFTARTGTALTTTGIGLEIDAITATVIGGTRLGGGRGTILGTVVGVLLLGVIRNGLNLNGVSPFWQPFIIGCILLITVTISVRTSGSSQGRSRAGF
jgi:ribose/xylose/arabinose/galactoside ABC-type transport system permease subunit